MKIYAPDYYVKFKCIADRCKHSCCIGWEIDIDDEALGRYETLQGEIGERIRKNISKNADCPHFITDNNEKCPFLNKDGLCDIIIELGEDMLCDICSEHPRFRNFFSDRVEIGLGMCCEAAAELILGVESKVALTELDGDGAEVEETSADEESFFELRERLITILQDRSVPIFDRLKRVKAEVGYTIPDVSDERAKDMFSSLEYMSEDFGRLLSSVWDTETELTPERSIEIPLEQLAIYFIIRHTADGIYGDDLPERVAFCALCVEAVYRLCKKREAECGGEPFATLCDVAREFSSEIEYSTDNIDSILDALSN